MAKKDKIKKYVKKINKYSKKLDKALGYSKLEIPDVVAVSKEELLDILKK